MALYELAVLGAPSEEQVRALQSRFEAAAQAFRLELGRDIQVSIKPVEFSPSDRSAGAAIFFGGHASDKLDPAAVMRGRSIPILPVATSESQLKAEIPESLRGFNCLFYDRHGPDRVFATLLSCLGLLRSQRRVFLSYKRAEASAAATQLFGELSARNFSVFLDTHSVPAAVDFQEELWHQLVDVDIVIMLDTKSYFSSRWTAAEYGRALAKGISVLRVQWPNTSPSMITSTSAALSLNASDLDADGTLTDGAVQALCGKLEQLRGTAYAVRHLSAVSQVEDAISRIEGRVDGIGPHSAMHVRLRTGHQLVVHPIVGVPTAVTLQEAVERSGELGAAVIYDHVGLKRSWQNHLHWLAQNFKGARWIKVTDVAWAFAGWEIDGG